MTQTFVWSAVYAVGVPQLDQEHQRLFGLAEGMHRAMIEGKGKAALESLLAGLLDYAWRHFAREEEFMQRIRYPDYLPHRQQHEDLRSKVRTMQDRAASGEVTMTIEAMQFLMDWLKVHTIASDRRIGAHIRATRRAAVQ